MTDMGQSVRAETRDERRARLEVEALEYAREMAALEHEPPMATVADLAARNRWDGVR